MCKLFLAAGELAFATSLCSRRSGSSTSISGILITRNKESDSVPDMTIRNRLIAIGALIQDEYAKSPQKQALLDSN